MTALTEVLSRGSESTLSYIKGADGVSVYRYDQQNARTVGPRLALFATMIEATTAVNAGRELAAKVPVVAHRGDGFCMSKTPRRRCLLTLKLGADDREGLIRELENIAREMRRGHLWGNCAMGGYSAGYALDVSEDETVTHDSYLEAINKMIEAESAVAPRVST